MLRRSGLSRDFPRPARLFVWAVLALTLAVRVGTLIPEVRSPHGMLNDMVLHDAAIRSSARAMARGDGALDGWLGAVSVGYPFLRQYQPASHVLGAVVLRALGEDVTSASAIRAWLTAIAMTLFPLAVYRAARDFGLGRVGAAISAAVSPLLEAPLLLGLTDQAYLWRGFGLYSQCLGAIPFVLGIGRSARALETGRGLIPAGLLVGASLVTHFIYGWLAALIVGAIAVCDAPALLGKRLARLAVIGLCAGGVSACILLPAVSTGAYANHSAIEPDEKWDGYGPQQLGRWTAEGRLLDGDAGVMRANRIPVVTILAALGLLLAAGRIPPLGRAIGLDQVVPGGAALRIAVMLVLSTVLLSGRATPDLLIGDWRIPVGRFVDFVPGAKYLHLQRMIAGTHLAAILLVGLVAHTIAATLVVLDRAREGQGLPETSPARRAEPPLLALAACGLFFEIVLAPAVLERIEFCRQNGYSAENAERGALAPGVVRLVSRAAELTPGRTYAGHARAEPYVKKLDGGVPLDAIATANDLDTLGHLWHPFALASDVAYYKFRPEEAIDAQTFAVSRFLIPETAPAPPFARLIETAEGISLYERSDVGWFSLVSAPTRTALAPKDAYKAVERWFGSLQHKLGVAPLLALDGETWEPAGHRDRPPEGAILESEVQDDRFRAQVEIEGEGAGYLCAKIAYHPALAVTVDGAPATVACVMPGFAAVRLAPGRHEVVFFVGPQRARPWIALAGALLIAALAWAVARTPLAGLVGPEPRAPAGPPLEPPAPPLEPPAPPLEPPAPPLEPPARPLDPPTRPPHDAAPGAPSAPSAGGTPPGAPIASP